MALRWGGTRGCLHQAVDVLPPRGGQNTRYEADLSQNAGNNVYERMPRATRDLILSQKVQLCDTMTRLGHDTRSLRIIEITVLFH
jgi:hypothetical protein